MDRSNFSNWQLSSSDSEDEQITKGMLLTVKNKEKDKSFCSVKFKDDGVEYVSLADRLKKRQSPVIVIDSDDDLPEFSLPKKPCIRYGTSDINTKSGSVSPSNLSLNPKSMEGSIIPVISLLEPATEDTYSCSDPQNDDLPRFSCLEQSHEAHETNDITVVTNYDSASLSNSSPSPKSAASSIKNSSHDPSMEDKYSHSDCQSNNVSEISFPKKAYARYECIDKTKDSEGVSSSNRLVKPKSMKSLKKKPAKVDNYSNENSQSSQESTSSNARLKMLKPEECMKYMECKISSRLKDMFQNFDLLGELETDFIVTCTLVENELPCIRWRRKLSLAAEDESQNVEYCDETDMLVAVSANDFADMVGSNTDSEAILSWIETIMMEYDGSRIHIACIGLEKYLKSLKAKKAKQDKNADCGSKKKKKMQAIRDVSAHDIEMASVKLHINYNITITYVEKPKDFITMVKQTTKSVSEAPYKRMKRQDIQFMNEIPSVKINANTGEGVRQVWKQMIQQFHNVTTVMATAITDRYPSICALIKAYNDCGTDVAKAEALLSDIPVRRGVGTIQTSRRIGPELSYKLYRQVMSLDPSEKLYR